MIYSMTGFGRASLMINGTAYAIEIRALNSKQLDINVRIPAFLREKEMEIRNIVGGKLKRGKIDISIHSEKKEESNSYAINTKVVDTYFQQIQAINQNETIFIQDYLQAILKLPNVLQAEETRLNESVWNELKSTIDTVVTKLDSFRIQEGNALEKDLLTSVNSIQSLTAEVEQNAPARIQNIQNRLEDGLSRLKDRIELNQDRLEQELIFYIEKMDLNEELVRLKNHCLYFKEIVKEEITLKGKKIGFIAQEMGREINTIGSKANNAPIQKLVIQMKDELEKIKEQSFNIL